MAPNLPGWSRHGLVDAVREQLGTNVTFENDVNLAALAEREHGHGRNVDSFVFIAVGTGVGMALIIDGRLYRGAHGAAGEIAYLPLGVGDPHDPANRRRGAFEEAASAAGVVRVARELGMPASVTAERVFTAARKGDAAARKAVDIEARRLGLAIATIAPMLDPELVILGGGVGRNGDLLLEPIEAELRRLVPFRPRVVVSALGQDAVLQGAVATALEVARERVFHRTPGRQIQQVG
jgi:predicted NBD/HSP70 family sugar kinase